MNSTIILLAQNEFIRIIRHPLVIIMSIVLFTLAIINAAGCSVLLPNIKSTEVGDVFFLGMSNTLHDTSLILSFLSMSIGIVSISNERSNGSLRVLMTKPVYKKDIITGKFIGINALLILLISIIVSLCVSTLMISYGMPFSLTDAFLRIGSYILILYLICILMSGLVMLFGIIFKNLHIALVLSVSSLYLAWFTVLPINFGDLRMLNPVVLYLFITSGMGHHIFDSIFPYMAWASAALPLIILMLFEIIAIFLIDCVLFIKEEA